MSHRLARLLLRYRWPLALLALAGIGASAGGVSRIRVYDDIRSFFRDDDPQLARLDRANRLFSQHERIGFAFAPADGNAFSREHIRFLAGATEAARALPFVVRVDSLTNRVRVSKDTFQPEPLIEDPQAVSDQALAGVRSYALRSADIRNIYVSSGADASAILLAVSLPEGDDTAQRRLVDAGEAFRREVMASHPGLEAYFFGERVSRQTIFDLNGTEVSRLTLFAAGLTFLLMWVLLRSAAAVAISLVMAVLAVAATLGIWGWLGLSLNANSQAAPQLLVLLANSYGTRMFASYLRGLRAGLSRREAMSQSVADNLYPVALCSQTTAIGFLSLNVCSDPSLRDFGNLIAGGVLVAFSLSVLLLPACGVLLVRRASPAGALFQELLMRLARRVTDRPRRVFVTLTMACLACLALLPLNRIDQSFDELFAERLEHRKTTDFLQARFGLGRLIVHVFDSGANNGAMDPAFLAQVEALAAWYRQRPEVVATYSYVDLLKGVNQALHGDDRAHAVLPASREEAAKLVFAYRFSAKGGETVSQMMTADRRHVSFVVGLTKMSNRRLLELEAAANSWIRASATRLQPGGTGYDLLFAHHTTRVARQLLIGALSTLAVVGLILLLAFRSAKPALLALIATALPSLVVFGIWGVVVGVVSPNTMMLLSISIGLLVDDNIYLVATYLRQRRTGDARTSMLEAMRRSAVGSASTSIALGVGVLVFVFSAWIPVRDIALFLGPSVLIGLMLSLAWLPGALLLMDGRLEPPAVEPESKYVA